MIGYDYKVLSKEDVLDTVHVYPRSRQHAVCCLVLGVGSTPILLTLPALFGFPINLIYIAFILTSLVIGFIGILKILEPRVSLTLCKDCLEFHHRCGGWVLKWPNIVRIDQPALQDGLEWFSLPYIGIKIREYEPLLNIISAKLAVKLLSEQRSLLIQVLQQEYMSGHIDTNFDLIEESLYRSPTGHIYQGAVGMMGHRMARMRALLGYDLFIPANSLDRDPQSFIHLLRNFQQEALAQQRELEWSCRE